MISAGDRIDFIKKQIIDPRTRQPMELAQFQEDWLEDTFSDGCLSSVLSLPRKNGKTSLCAAVALSELALNHDADVVVGAVKVKQANRPSGLFGVMKTLCRLSGLGYKISRNNNEPTIKNEDTGCVAEIVSFSDEDAAQGLNPSMLVLDEIGTSFWSELRWASAQMAMGGRGTDARLIGISTPASFDSQLYRLRQQVMSGSAAAELRYTEHSAPLELDPYQYETWRIGNPALGIFLHRTSLDQDAASLAEPLFRCFRLGQWVHIDAMDGWLGLEGPGHWDATVAEFDLEADGTVWLGVDKSMLDDFSAVVAIQQYGDRWLSKCFTFKPQPTIDHAAVRQCIRDLCRKYRVAAVGYDPRYFVESAQELEEEGLPMVQVPQGPRLVPAYAMLHKAVTEERWFHEDDPEYRTAMLSAVPRLMDTGGFVLSKGKSLSKIDPAVATAIALSVSSVNFVPDESFRIF